MNEDPKERLVSAVQGILTAYSRAQKDCHDYTWWDEEQWDLIEGARDHAISVINEVVTSPDTNPTALVTGSNKNGSEESVKRLVLAVKNMFEEQEEKTKRAKELLISEVGEICSKAFLDEADQGKPVPSILVAGSNKNGNEEYKKKAIAAFSEAGFNVHHACQIFQGYEDSSEGNKAVLKSLSACDYFYIAASSNGYTGLATASRLAYAWSLPFTTVVSSHHLADPDLDFYCDRVLQIDGMINFMRSR